MLEFIDTHSHNSDEAFANDADAVIRRSVENGISHLLQADIDSRERPAMRELCARYPGVLHPMLGLYPGSVAADWQQELSMMEACSREGVVAVGEIGLDYHFSTEFKKEQKEALRIQLELASKWDLPVNIHLRDATADFVDIIEDCRQLHLRGNLHAFSGSAEIFKRLLKSGDWYVGIGGVLTFKNAGIAKEVLEIPLERMVLETDAPYLAPTPLRGSRNESSNIPLIAAKLAEIKGVRIEDISRITCANARKLFKI